MNWRNDRIDVLTINWSRVETSPRYLIFTSTIKSSEIHRNPLLLLLIFRSHFADILDNNYDFAHDFANVRWHFVDTLDNNLSVIDFTTCKAHRSWLSITHVSHLCSFSTTTELNQPFSPCEPAAGWCHSGLAIIMESHDPNRKVRKLVTWTTAHPAQEPIKYLKWELTSSVQKQLRTPSDQCNSPHDQLNIPAAQHGSVYYRPSAAYCSVLAALHTSSSAQLSSIHRWPSTQAAPYTQLNAPAAQQACWIFFSSPPP